MSYKTITMNAQDVAFGQRLAAGIAQEQLARGQTTDPGPLQGTMTWAVASASDVEAAYASALAANNPDPGGDETVITDQMILSHVQGNWPAP